MLAIGRNLLSLWLVAVLLCALLSGCVHRRMTIRTNPPGAQVYIDGYEIGTTPCSTSFLYYGTRNIRLERDGYETLHVKQYIPPPWYEIPPLDFFAENLAPGELRDNRTLSYTLQPQLLVPTDQLLNRAEELRQATHSSNNPLAPPGVPNPLALPPANPGGFAPLPNQAIPETLPNPTGVQSIPPQGQRIEQVYPAPGAGEAVTIPPQ